MERDDYTLGGWSDAVLTVKLTGVRTDADGRYLYAWTRQSLDPKTGDYRDCYPPQHGTTGMASARELNNLQVDVTDSPIVKLYLRAVIEQPVYEFDAGDLPNKWVRCRKVVTDVYCLAGQLYYTAEYDYVDASEKIVKTNSTPCGVKHTMAGVTNGTCTSCALVNGT